MVQVLVELSFSIRGFIKRPAYPQTENQIDHNLISQQWRTSLQDVRVKRGAENQAGCKKAVCKYKTAIWCHEIERPQHKTGLSNWVAKPVWIPVPSRRRRRRRRRRRKIKNLSGDEDEQAQDTDINAQWEKTTILVDTCGSVLGRMKRTRKEWLSDETHRKVEERLKAKQILNDARKRQGKHEAIRYYNEKNREVKKSCQRDKRNLIEGIAREAEGAAKKNDLRTLYTL